MLDTAKRRAMLRQMILVRAFEEKLEELYQRKAMFGSTHSYRGQEAIAVGVCSALQSTDLIASYHRGTGHLIAKGADLYTLLCECMGREAGYSKGRGGKMHMGDMSFGFIGNTGTVGGTVPTATGAALSAKVRGSQEVVASFFGDGAANQGVVHEAMNLAGVWKLPVIFCCENNGYMEYTPISSVTAVKYPAADRAASYGLEGQVIDGNDADIVYQIACAAIVKARSGGGPSLIECLTYRHSGHSRADPAKYRPKEEVEEWMKRDPVALYRSRLLGAGVAEAKLAKIEADAMAKLEQATETAKASPTPALETALTDVWADGGNSWRN